MVKKVAVVAVVVLSLFGIAACGGSGDGDEQANEQGQNANEPDLDGIPDVVAVVNGDKITKDDFVEMYSSQFQQMAMQAQQTGQSPDQDKLKKQVAESMVGTQLLLQEADKQDVKAPKKKVDQKLDELAEQSGIKSKDKLLATLKKQQGLDKSQVMDDIAKQVKLERLITEEAGDQSPSEKELREYYDQMVQQQEQGQKGDEQQDKGQQGNQDAPQTPPFKEIKPQLEQQLEQQNVTQAQQALVKKLRKKADVTINL